MTKKNRTPISHPLDLTPGPFPSGKGSEDGEREQGKYTTGEWSGKVQFKCTRCAFDVLENRKAMLEHLMNAHSSMWAMEELIKLETAEAPAAKNSEAKPARAQEPAPLQTEKEDLKEEHNG